MVSDDDVSTSYRIVIKLSRLMYIYVINIAEYYIKHINTSHIAWRVTVMHPHKRDRRAQHIITTTVIIEHHIKHINTSHINIASNK